METFKIEVKEILSRIIEVEAKSSKEALSKVEELYKKQGIILDAADFVVSEFFELEN